MSKPLIFAEFIDQTSVPVGKLRESIQAYKDDFQTGLVEVVSPEDAGLVLLFARGELVTAYRGQQTIVRFDPTEWLEKLNGSTPRTSLYRLALTPQDVRIFKVLIEQKGDTRCVSTGELNLEEKFADWMANPVPALAQVRWPEADALVLFPGQGAPPYYSLFMTANQILHSTGGVNEILGWKQSSCSASLFSSEPRTMAWNEYLLHYAFSSLVVTLLAKFEKLIGRILLNQIIREVNFKATAHDWHLSIHAGSVNDQTIFSSPTAAAEVYSRLLEVIFHHFESVLGAAMLDLLVREAVFRLPTQARQVVKEYLPITSPD